MNNQRLTTSDLIKQQELAIIEDSTASKVFFQHYFNFNDSNYQIHENSEFKIPHPFLAQEEHLNQTSDTQPK